MFIKDFQNDHPLYHGVAMNFSWECTVSSKVCPGIPLRPAQNDGYMGAEEDLIRHSSIIPPIFALLSYKGRWTKVIVVTPGLFHGSHFGALERKRKLKQT